MRVAPLSFYLGASVDIGDSPSVDLRRETVDLPAGFRQFERWAGRMLSRSFQADCAVRYAAATGKRLAGIDVQAILGYAPEELMLMGMPDRFRLYMEGLRSSGRAFNTWHTAAYVDPVPSEHRADTIPDAIAVCRIYASRLASHRAGCHLAVRQGLPGATCPGYERGY